LPIIYFTDCSINTRTFSNCNPSDLPFKKPYFSRCRTLSRFYNIIRALPLALGDGRNIDRVVGLSSPV